MNVLNKHIDHDKHAVPTLNIFHSSRKRIFFVICEDMMTSFLLYSIILNISVMVLHINIMLIMVLPLTFYSLLLTLMRLNIKNQRLVIILSTILCCLFLLIPFPGYERFLYGAYAAIMLIISKKKVSYGDFIFFTKNCFIGAEIVLVFNLLSAYAMHSSPLKYLSLFLALAFSLLLLTYLNKRDLPTVLKKEYVLETTENFSLKKFIIILFSSFLILTYFIILITSNLDYNINHTLIKALELDEHLPPAGSPYYQGSNNFHPYFNLSLTSLSSTLYSTFGITNNHNQDADFSLYFVATILIIAFAVYKIIKHILSPKAAPNDVTTEAKSTFLQEDLKKDIKNVFSNFSLDLSNKARLRKYYKKLIKRYRERGLIVKNSSTSQELQDGILNLTGNNVDNITKIYDKCRYSSYEPNKKDIDKLRKK